LYHISTVISANKYTINKEFIEKYIILFF